MNRLTRRCGRLAALGSGAVLVLTVLCATPASAHVTVHPNSMPAGSGDIELTFRVPNERDNADTVALQVFFPTNLPLLTVDVLPVPGWTAKVSTRTLGTPLQSGDGPVNQVVTEIAWTATAGGIAPGQYEDFPVSAGQAPSQPGDVVFKSLQTYSSGEVVRWIEVASSQDPDPEMPAPVLTLTGPAPPAGAATTSSGSTTAEGLAVAALVVAAIALLAVLMLFLRGRRNGDGADAPRTDEDAAAPRRSAP
jgi:uncharacterized protein YcnI